MQYNVQSAHLLKENCFAFTNPIIDKSFNVAIVKCVVSYVAAIKPHNVNTYRMCKLFDNMYIDNVLI
jgi:hypothetical protein